MPRGVLPRGVQTWLMVGIAVGMLAILLTSDAPNRQRDQSAEAPAQAPSADRVATTRTACACWSPKRRETPKRPHRPELQPAPYDDPQPRRRRIRS